ncbi:alcohol dehydrogenase catalytic domain-containing protein [Breznakiella homolactica]|uniref:Alcohol dehydrogenase catalytic domain-containing protein n=1 Tax=Breznakiella homolactica TaxID=2798577 RepID=A0A7T7XN20_9SPIR|nr:alcohol dehydrogenase catalytic domain-containing protein [Breznakiella homolactica]QQO09374.1 alcohol dehydrogenase catalytic domain-containing protein [Breznakiella homolactica]
MDTMKAAVFEKQGSFVLKDVPVPSLAGDYHVLVEVEAVSICGTDVHITADPPGYIATDGTTLGHELCGTIIEKGKNVTHLDVGDRVVVNPNNYCGVCVYCRKNLPNQCSNIEALGIDYDGAFAKYVCIHSKVAYKIDKTVSPETAACAEPLACAINGLNKVNIKPGDSAVVIGAGPIGLMAAMLLKASGIANLFILETSEYRIDFARKLNLGSVLNPLKDDARKVIYDKTEIGADFVFDMTGSQIAPSIQLVRKGGSVVLFGVNKNSRTEIAQSEITTKEIAVLGTWLANATFPQAIKIIEEKSIDLASLITDVMPLDEIHSGIKKLASGQAIKIIIKP